MGSRDHWFIVGEEEDEKRVGVGGSGGLAVVVGFDEGDGGEGG